MSFDLFQSRTNCHELCKWWTRNESTDYEPDELIMQRIPSGTFMAKEVSPEQGQNVIVGGAFMVDKSSVTIKSPDDLSGIKENDLVLYQGEKWIVLSVQKTKARVQNTMFASDKNCSHFWYLELRK